MQYSISGDGRQRVKDDASRRIYISGVGLEYVDNGSVRSIVAKKQSDQALYRFQFHHNYVPHCYNSWYGETICSTELMANIFYNWYRTPCKSFQLSRFVCSTRQYFGPRIREDNPTTCKAKYSCSFCALLG